MADKPVVLCVDDDSHVVESMQLNLHRHYSVVTALSGQQGLEVLLNTPETAVVVADMRMPEMDGATFLSVARKVAPDAVRMLLTGYTDVEAAVRAVNEGQIFRFLTKPCSPPDLLATIAAAVDQHRLITAERVLLENTLLGSVRALVELLALINPLALGRAVRIRDRAAKAVANLEIEGTWHVELAAMLCQAGTVLLPEDTARRLHDGEPLDAHERERFIAAMGAINGVLTNIPRLEPVMALLEELEELVRHGPSSDAPEISAGARLLHAITEIDALESQGRSLREALRILGDSEALYGPEVLGALETLTDDPSARETRRVTPDALSDGMVLAEDLRTLDDVLILPRGFGLNPSSREHIRNFSDRLGTEPVAVFVAAEPTGIQRAGAN